MWTILSPENTTLGPSRTSARTGMCRSPVFPLISGATICVSYRLSLDDEEWTPVKGEFWGFERPGVSYTLLTGRTVVLGEKLESEGRLLPRRTSSIVEISTLKIILAF